MGKEAVAVSSDGCSWPVRSTTAPVQGTSHGAASEQLAGAFSCWGYFFTEEPLRSSEEALKHERLVSKQKDEICSVFLPIAVQSHTKIHFCCH